MKEKQPTFVYHYQNYIGQFKTITAASKATHVNYNNIRRILDGELDKTKNGYAFFDHKLEKEEMENLPMEDDYDNEFYFPKKEEKIKKFKIFIYKKLNPIWFKQPKILSEVERKYVNAFLNSL